MDEQEVQTTDKPLVTPDPSSEERNTLERHGQFYKSQDRITESNVAATTSELTNTAFAEGWKMEVTVTPPIITVQSFTDNTEGNGLIESAVLDQQETPIINKSVTVHVSEGRKLEEQLMATVQSSEYSQEMNQMNEKESTISNQHEVKSTIHDNPVIMPVSESKNAELECLVNSSFNDKTSKGKNEDSSLLSDADSKVITSKNQESHKAITSSLLLASDAEQSKDCSEFSVETVVMTRNFSLIEQYGTSSSDSEPDSESSSTESSTNLSSTNGPESSDSECASSPEEVKMKEKSDRKPAKPKLVTSGELLLEDLPPIEDLHISVPQTEIQQIGVVTAIVDQLVVIQAFKNSPALDLDSVLFLEEGKPLGQIFDVFGQVVEPSYSVRFNSKEEIATKGIHVGMSVFWAPKRNDVTSYVFMEQLKRIKGSDASWEHNNEPPEDAIDYSDDEQERLAKQRLKGQRNQTNISDLSENNRGVRRGRNRHQRRVIHPARFQHTGNFPQRSRLPEGDFQDTRPLHSDHSLGHNWNYHNPPPLFGCLSMPSPNNNATLASPKGDASCSSHSRQGQSPVRLSAAPPPVSHNGMPFMSHRPPFLGPESSLVLPMSSSSSNSICNGSPLPSSAQHPPLSPSFPMYHPSLGQSRLPPIPFMQPTFDVTRPPPPLFPGSRIPFPPPSINLPSLSSSNQNSSTWVPNPHSSSLILDPVPPPPPPL